MNYHRIAEAARENAAMPLAPREEPAQRPAGNVAATIDAERVRELVAELRRLHEQATPGKWRNDRGLLLARDPDPAHDQLNEDVGAEWTPLMVSVLHGMDYPSFESDEDADLTAAMHNALPTLAAAAEAGAAAQEWVAEMADMSAATMRRMQEHLDREAERIVALKAACRDVLLLAQNGDWHVTDGRLTIQHPRAGELWASIRAALPLDEEAGRSRIAALEAERERLKRVLNIPEGELPRISELALRNEELEERDEWRRKCEALEAERERLRAALSPFAPLASNYGGEPSRKLVKVPIRVGDLFTARAALREQEGG